MAHDEPAMMRSRCGATWPKTRASDPAWRMGYTGAVIRRCLVPSLMVAVVAVVGVSSRALFAQGADAADEDEADAADEADDAPGPSLSDDGTQPVMPASSRRPRRRRHPSASRVRWR